MSESLKSTTKTVQRKHVAASGIEKKSKRENTGAPPAQKDPRDRLSQPNLGEVERRLLAARKSKRLDLSLPTVKTARVGAVCQMLPRQLVLQERAGYHLVELWMTNHKISVLTPEISEFQCLRVLGLGGNQLTTLPEEISRLCALESLFLENNRFRSLPSNVSLPRNLRHLRLDRNELQILPLEVTKLRLLNRLGLSHNQLHSLPPEIRRLTNLVELDLDYNMLGPTLPDEIEHLRSLERLGLEGNMLNGKPASLEVLPHLQYCRLNGNFGSQDVEGSRDFEEQRAPVRHDGYFQTREGYETDRPTQSRLELRRQHSKVERPLITKIVDCRDLNVVNTASYSSKETRSFIQESFNAHVA